MLGVLCIFVVAKFLCRSKNVEWHLLSYSKKKKIIKQQKIVMMRASNGLYQVLH